MPPTSIQPLRPNLLLCTLRCSSSSSSPASLRSVQRTYASKSPFKEQPSPPRLPKEDQEIFERLQRQSTGAFSTPLSQQQGQEDATVPPPTSPSQGTHSSSPQTNTSPNSRPTPFQINQSPHSSSSSSSAPSRFQINQSPASQQEQKQEQPEEEQLHPHVRRGARPEFEGEINPKTGEVGGPKNEPLRWGSAGDWSYNGRVSDF